MNLRTLVENAPKSVKEEFTYKKYKKGNFIIHPDETNEYLFILTKGSTEVYRQSYLGSMLSLYVNDTYSFFGELEVFNKDIKTFIVIARTDCEVIIIHKKTVHEWMKADFDFSLYIVEQLAGKLIEISNKASKLSLLTVKERVLISIHSHYRIGDLEQLTKQMLSNEVCAPIRSVNRAIFQCIDEKLIDYKKKKFEVISKDVIEKQIENVW